MADCFHVNYEKTLGRWTVKSFGGGSPRWVSIDDAQAPMVVNMDEVKDLSYLLDRLFVATDYK